jgi:Aspartyl/Asparaginyl beta-hydroxylase
MRMNFGETHRFLKQIDVAPLVERVLAVDDALWDSDEDLRQTLTGPRPTRAIYLYYTNALQMPHDRRITQSDVARRAGWAWFAPTVTPILSDILALYPPGGTVIRCQIAALLPGGRIARHQDVSPLLRASHRVHVPLVTWPEVTFLIDDAPFQFPAGYAFELNNQRFHEVRHDGDHVRHHLIFDILPADYDPAPMAEVFRRVTAGA